MATTGVRITVRNVQNGGYMVTQETFAGYGSSTWQERHRQAFGVEELGLLGAVQCWVEDLMKEGGHAADKDQ